MADPPANTDANRLDPGAIEAQSFSSTFRGYDPSEVRTYLKSLSDALRRSERERSTSVRAVSSSTGSSSVGSSSDGADGDGVHDGGADVAGDGAQAAAIAALEQTIAELESERDDYRSRFEQADAARIEALAVAQASAGTGGEPAELDEARMTQLLGEETVRVLDSARSAAADITARAEATAAERLAELEALEAERLAAIEADKESSAAEIAALTAAATAAATEERETAAAEAAAEREAAATEAARLRTEAEEAATAARSEADEAAESARTAAEEVAVAVKARAEEVAKETRLAAEAEAEAVRERASAAQSDAEAEAARIRAEAEADASTSQDAAREEARMMLTEAQSLREKVLGDLVEKRRVGRHQLDQAKAARDRLARSLGAVRAQLDESLTDLDVAVPEARQAMDAATASAPVDAEREAQALASELDAARGAGIPIPGSEPPSAPAEEPSDAAQSDAAQSDAAQSDSGTPAPEPDPEIAPAVAATSPSPTGPEGDLDADDAAGESGEAEEDPIPVPPVFEARDIALTKNGPGLRRQFKRALADDQSDVLDRLRQKRKKLKADDLPDERSQALRYIDAIGPALTAMADAGAESAGGSSAPAELVDALIERTATTLIGSVRSRLVGSVEVAADADEVLEPIRAHYREARGSVLPELSEDALHEAYAIGAYGATADGTELAWVADPRQRATADCNDNTFETAIKPAAFPTGHHHPLGAPGCRCLVIPATEAAEL